MARSRNNGIGDPKVADFLKLLPGGELRLDDPEGPLNCFQEIAILAAELKRRTDPEAHPYKHSFRRFLLEACWTKDEARGGRVARVPDWPFLPALADALVTEPMFFIEKSRRVLASWTVCCFDIWVAAGGVDPRWRGKKTREYPEGEPTLVNSDRNRQVFVAARQFDQANWFLHERIRFVVEQSLARGLREQWPDFPDWTFKEGEASLSNGSKINAVAQGADQLRGPGATLHHWEEIAFWEKAKQTVEGSKPTVQGGGHIVAVTTPQVNSFARDIVKGSMGSNLWQ